MDPGVARMPAGVALGPVSERVFEILARYTVFPWPVLMAQAQRLGLSPANVQMTDLPELVPLLAAGVERFTSPEKARAARQELESLLAA
jgi:hypothetical protein